VLHPTAAGMDSDSRESGLIEQALTKNLGFRFVRIANMQTEPDRSSKVGECSAILVTPITTIANRASQALTETGVRRSSKNYLIWSG
jgi:hypothetical protein